MGEDGEDEVSQRVNSQLEGNPLLDLLLLSAEERQNYETFAPPQSIGLLQMETPQQAKF